MFLSFSDCCGLGDGKRDFPVIAVGCDFSRIGFENFSCRKRNCVGEETELLNQDAAREAILRQFQVKALNEQSEGENSIL